MKKKYMSRRDFLKVGAGAAAGVMTLPLLGCSGGSDGGSAASTTDQSWHFLGQHGITAVYQPADTTLYRQLLPAEFQMPDSPLVVISIVSYDSVTKPLVPYREGFAMLSCTHQGYPGLYTLTMPVTDKTANDAGISLGFPKYVADKIELTSTDGTWSGNVVHKGRSVMSMRFTPSGTKSTLSRSNPGPTLVNLSSPGKGSTTVDVNVIGQQNADTTSGTAEVSVDPGESWRGILEGATLVSAQLDEIEGNWTLAGGNGMNVGSVGIARIMDGRIDLAVEEAIALLGGIGAVTRGKQKIMLKPNLVSDSKKSTTNPEVVRALAQLMLDAGKEVSIGEGSAACNNFNILNGVVYRTKRQEILNSMQQHIFDTLGYSDLALSLGIPLVNLHSGEMVPVNVPGGYIYDTINIHRALAEVDLLCSVPIMKTHILGGVTLGMKNLIGTYPGIAYGSVRSQVHDQAANLEGSGVAAAVIDIVRANKLGLVVMDASTAMEGNGPENGDLIKMNLIIAGTNPLATDMVAAAVMGFLPTEIPTFQWANKAGMEPSKLAQIEIRGETVKSVRRAFKRPDTIPWSTLRPNFGAQEL